VELELFRNIDANEIQAKINGTLPQGYELLSVRKVPVFFPSLDSLLNVATYEIVAHVPEERIQQFLAQKEIIIEKKKENRVERIDARPLIRELKVDPSGLFLQMRFGPKRNVKPERILQALLGISDNEVKLVPITRVALLIEKRDGSLSEP
jgi:radical SAM-linked protein